MPSLTSRLPVLRSHPHLLRPTASFVRNLRLRLGPGEFLFAGAGLVMTFGAIEPRTTVGTLSAEEGRYADGQWQNLLWLSGDQTHQGRHIRLEPERFSIRRVKVRRQ